MKPALRALNRFGLGARPGEAARLADPRGWLEAQLEGGAPALEDPAPQARRELEQAVRAAGPRPTGDVRRDVRQRAVPIRNAEADAALDARVTSDRPFVERLVAFWSNHLCVSAPANGAVAQLAGPFEREVIRTHVLGRFEEMVLASARHPAMLLYLDNFSSIGPGSRAATRGNARASRGLNENYARELLELHTLGVDGGYTQDDVLELARALTGWSLRSPRTNGGLPRIAIEDVASGSVEFAFFPERHEPGARTLLGKRYAESGAEQAEAAIRDLCAHPATARFVAAKLVRHFVSDEPPARAVDAIASEFVRTHGDLERVARALIALTEAWDEGARKFRTPQDWLIASLRALGAKDAPPGVRNTLAALRQPLWSPPAPKGWGDLRVEWADPDSLMNRAELARTLARRARGDAGDPSALLEVVELSPSDPLRGMLADRSIERGERTALALASPAFQWR